jgi:ATP-dependent helicase/nuclease subunit B
VPIQRIFPGLDSPSLHVTADYLLQRYAAGDSADLSGALIVVPGGRAGRRLLELLVQQADERALILTPPQIETVGRVPEKLYRAQRPLATDLVQQLAWARVLQQADPQQLAELLSTPPGGNDLQWLEYGRLLGRLHTELAADGLDFDDVARRGAELELFAEQRRWRALHHLQQAYLALLDGLELWDIQTARRVAVQRQECQTDQDLILVGTVDMTILLRRMLDQVADRVTALVFAPPAWADRFDEHGCLIPAAWQTVEVPIDDRQVHIVESPADQADRIARCLAEWGGRFRGDEITIGLADETITPLVQRQLEQCGVPCRAAAGLPISRTAVWRLLAAVEAYLRSGGYAEFAALVRHPDVGEDLRRRGIRDGWLNDLDGYYNEHLQTHLGGTWLSEDRASRVPAVYAVVEGWLEGFQGPAQPLTAWAEPVRTLLRAIYGHRLWNRDVPAERTVVQSLQKIQDALTQHAQTIPAPLLPIVSAADALRLLMEPLESVSVAAPPNPAAVELLGWLELALDDAPALIACGLNEGYVPSSVNADLFLPDALRSRLGVQDNARRYARDAYALSALLATRDQVQLIAGRRTTEGDPLIPSRLLLAADRQTLARRAIRFFGAPEPLDALPPLAGSLVASRPQPDFRIPRPQPLDQPITELRVTAFRDYLACPYRFYLRHVLGLRPVDDAIEELDGAAFGNLLHDVLRDLGSGPYRDCSDSEQLRAALEQSLDRHVMELFGDRPLATVGVQIEQLRQRLKAFAQVQAKWAGQGWQIEFTEVPAYDAGGSAFDVDGRPILLRGRIDRIDVHRETGQRLILDYKSSDAGKSPDAVHRRSGQWVDLQLPLYRHLAGSLGLEGTLRLGYILLPKDIANVGFQLADWTPQELQQADEKAREIVRNIRDEAFWPPASPPPLYAEDLSPICLDSVFDKPPIGV